jgi:DNA replicative helicase MCM subunit Mcm2 (Cdc46/Mcm family)
MPGGRLRGDISVLTLMCVYIHKCTRTHTYIYTYIYAHKCINACVLTGKPCGFMQGGRLRGDINLLMLGDPSTAKSQLRE